MWFILAFVLAVAIFYFIGKRPERLLQRGKLVRAQHIERQGKAFYLEEVAFDDYHQALHHYFHLIPQFSDRKDMLETQSSYMDWTDTTLRFPDCTLQLVRRVNRIVLIKSHAPMSIAEFDRLTEGL